MANKGRPTIFSEELAAKICELIEDGLSLRKVCELDDMPNRASVNKWLNENKEFSDQYVRACKVRRDNKFEEMYEIAQTVEEVPRARLLIDVIKWQLSKEEPKKYGDKVDMTTNGKDMVIPILGGSTKNALSTDELNEETPEA